MKMGSDSNDDGNKSPQDSKRETPPLRYNFDYDYAYDLLQSQFTEWKNEFAEQMRKEVEEKVKREIHLYFNTDGKNYTGAGADAGADAGTNDSLLHSFGAVATDAIDGAGQEPKEAGFCEGPKGAGFCGVEEGSDNTTSGGTGSNSMMTGILTKDETDLTSSHSSFNFLHMQREIRLLQQQFRDIRGSIGMSSVSQSAIVPRSRSMRGRVSLRSSTFLRISKYRREALNYIDEEGEECNENDRGQDLSSSDVSSLEEDTFSLMMMSTPFSQAWVLGLVVFLLQATLAVQVAMNQRTEGSSVLNIPFTASTVVRFGQVLTIILCLIAQSDVLTSIDSFIVLGRGSNWDVVIGEEGNRSRSKWMTRIMLPISLKLIQGIAVVVVCYVTILQSDDIIVLLKDFTALMVLSDTDNIFFDLAAYGFLGQHLKDKTVAVRNTEIYQIANFNDRAAVPTSIATGADATNMVGKTPSLRRKITYNIRTISLSLLFLPLAIGWFAMVIRQENGTIFKQMYPGCINPTEKDAFRLAKDYFGDGYCYGGPFNTLECKFEGGDCENFNLVYPLCKENHLIDVELRIGNGVCDLDLNIAECKFDRYDCCPFEIVSNTSFGDGRCHGGRMSTKRCAYDNGDCDYFRELFPSCNLDDLSNEDGSIDVILGDGICQGGVYNTESCGYEYGDCDKGQIGQDIAVGDVYAANSMHNQYTEDSFFFNVKLSLDGSKLFVGKFISKNGMDDSVPGLAMAYTFNAKKQMWMSMGSEISGVGEDEIFGYSIAMNYNGSRVAVGAPAFDDGENITWYFNNGYVEAFDFIEGDNMWVPIGKKIIGQKGKFLGFSIDMSADGSRLAIAAPSLFGKVENGEVSIWDLHEQRHWVQVGQKIRGKNNMENIGSKFLYMSSSNGSSVIFSTSNRNDASVKNRVYRYDDSNGDGWSQLGDDIPSPYPGVGKTSQISADGNRIAVSSHAGNPDAPGQVQVFDFNAVNNTWDQVGETIFEPSSKKDESPSSGNGFGRTLTMSSDGNLLAIASIGLDCVESDELCATGSVHLFGYDEARHRFNVIPSSSSPLVTTGTIQARQRNQKSSIFGLQVSFNSDGSLISISGYDIRTKEGFVNVYDINELFYPNCTVYNPYLINDGQCVLFEPYISEACGFDGGDCPEPSLVEGLPGCYVPDPKLLGDGRCFSFLPYNTEECNFDGGDCKPKSMDMEVEVEGYPGCNVWDPERIGNGICTDYLPYNSKECGFDGGDCL